MRAAAAQGLAKARDAALPVEVDGRDVRTALPFPLLAKAPNILRLNPTNPVSVGCPRSLPPYIPPVFAAVPPSLTHSCAPSQEQELRARLASLEALKETAAAEEASLQAPPIPA